jgi:hypothetical protein
MKFFLLFCTGISLFATVNEPLRVGIFSGYRNDRIHWHLQDPGEGGAVTYSELDRDIQFWENGLTLKAVYRDLTFFLKGAYGTFGKGEAIQKYPNAAQFQSQTNGWTADGTGYLGYAVNLTSGRMYQVILTPLIGYSISVEHLKRDHRPFKLLWNGFLFGGGFSIQSGGPLLFHAGYSYHLMHNRTKAKLQSELNTQQSAKTSSKGNGGQAGWAEIDWQFHPSWRLGLGGEIRYFFTRVVNLSVFQADRADYAQKFKLRWTTVSGWLQIERIF